MGCGFDENLQQGASYFQRCKYLAGMRVIAENFAAKLPPSPQLTVLEHQSSKAHDARTSSLQVNQRRQTSRSIFKTHILEEKRALFRRRYSIVCY
jgi:hypothetical protein